jgi:hypothetical protein
VSAATADQTLEWEARHRPRAATAAFLGGLLTLAGGVYNGLSLQDTPTPLFLDSLRNVAEDGPIGGRPSIRVDQFQFFADHTTQILLGALILGLGALASALAITYLAHATRFRTDRFPRIGLHIALVGGVLVLVGSILTALGTSTLVDDLLDTQRTVDAVSDAERPGTLYAGRIIQGVGSLTLAASYVLVGLHSMRVGLLTRFMGVIGIFAGVLVIIPLIAVAPVLQPFWLISIGVLFLGRWPGGVPAAWRTGKAEPWPTAAEQREARMKQAGGRTPKRAEPPPTDTPDNGEAPVGKPHPSSKKRKRKRRG